MRVCLRFLVLVPIFLLFLLAAGCGEADPNGGHPKEEHRNAEHREEEVAAFLSDVPDNAEKESTDQEEYFIGSVNMGMNGEWFSEVMNGIWNAGQDLGVRVKMLDSAGSLETERENIRSLVEEGIDALVISPRDSTDSIENLQPAVDAKIPIITWNTSVNMDVTSFVCVDSEALGADTGDYLCEYMKTYGLTDVRLIIIDNRNYDVGIARCEGFRQSIKGMVDQKKIQVVAEADAETFEAGEALMKKLLKKHPEANAVWVWNQPTFLGTIEAIREAERDDMLILGTDMSMELAADMLGDDINLLAVTTQMPYNMGYKAVVTAVRALRGEDVDPAVFIPLATYKKEDAAMLHRYLEAHLDLVEWKGGQ